MKGKSVQKKRVTFSFWAPEAKEVFLTGDFNDWDPKSMPMRRDLRGTWKRQVTLKEGSYQYKYLIDGQWVHDPRKETIQNAFGTLNNLIHV